MKKILLAATILFSALTSQAQTDKSANNESNEAIRKQGEVDITKLPDGWEKGGNMLLGFNYTNVNNWVGASQKYNAVFNGALTYQADRKQGRTLWKNMANYAYTSQANPTTDGSFRTSSDMLLLSSMYAPQIKPKWFYAGNLDLRTQLFNSFNYSAGRLPQPGGGDSAFSKTQTGSLMTNGIIRAGVGIMYRPNKHISIYYSPLTANITTKLGAWAENQKVGAVPANKKSNFGLGSLARIDYINSWKTPTPLGTITYSSRMDLFTDYLDKPFTIIDFDWLNAVGFNLTKWISVAGQFNFRYYERTKQKLQNQNMIGLGFTYKL
jgi:hypothetical protein